MPNMLNMIGRGAICTSFRLISAHSPTPVLPLETKAAFSVLLANRFFAVWLVFFGHASWDYTSTHSYNKAEVLPEESAGQNVIL